MKSATDLIALAKENEQRIEDERKTNSIELCEKVGKVLEKLANNGQYPTTSIILQKHYRKNGYYVQKATTKEYSDERTSYNPIGEMIDGDLNIIINWFKQYDFKIEKREILIWQYGIGQMKALELNIVPDIN
jgi:hypothetical protein